MHSQAVKQLGEICVSLSDDRRQLHNFKIAQVETKLRLVQRLPFNRRQLFSESNRSLQLR